MTDSFGHEIEHVINSKNFFEIIW